MSNNTPKNKAELFMEKLDYEPLRDDPKTKDFFELAEKEAIAIVEEKKRKNQKTIYKLFPSLESPSLGWCYLIWHEQKRILKEKYNLDWETPAERFPNAKFC